LSQRKEVATREHRSDEWIKGKWTPIPGNLISMKWGGVVGRITSGGGDWAKHLSGKGVVKSREKRERHLPPSLLRSGTDCRSSAEVLVDTSFRERGKKVSLYPRKASGIRPPGSFSTRSIIITRASPARRTGLRWRGKGKVREMKIHWGAAARSQRKTGLNLYHRGQSPECAEERTSALRDPTGKGVFILTCPGHLGERCREYAGGGEMKAGSERTQKGGEYETARPLWRRRLRKSGALGECRQEERTNPSKKIPGK